MTTDLTPVSTKLPATIAIPADTEDADSDSLGLFVQVLINGIKWVTDIAAKLVEGGSITSSGDVELLTTSTHDFSVNAARFSPSADGGDMFLRGAAIGMRTVMRPAVNGGTVTIPYYMSRVSSQNSSVAATNWKLTAPIGGDADRRWVVRFFTTEAQVITIQDSTGATITTIKRDGPNANHGCELAWNGSAWEIIELMWYHG